MKALTLSTLFLAFALAARLPEPPATASTDQEAARTPAADEEANPLAWLTGHWIGEGLGGTVEEIWTAHRGGAMACVFRLIVDDETRMYELVTLSRATGSWEMRLRHFNSDLTAWEEKDGTLRWPLEDMGPRFARFGPVLYELDDDGKLHAFVEIEGREDPEELVMEKSNQPPKTR